jgi:hypothetical protein
MEASTSPSGNPFPPVNVVCAYEVSSHFDFNHRLAYYLSILFILTAPSHRVLTPLVCSFIVLYGAYNVVYAIGLTAMPMRLGPSLDIFPLHSLLLSTTYAFSALVFCRKHTVKSRKQWGVLMRGFFIFWTGFVVANFGKDHFEKKVAKRMMAEVTECKSVSETTIGDGFFAVSEDIACLNPCASPSTVSGIMLPGQSNLKPILWGRLFKTGEALKFSPKQLGDLTLNEVIIVVLFGIALSLTLWVNFYTSPRITRNTVFSIFGRRGASSARNGLAKLTALAWFTWSYFAIMLVAAALPFVVSVQEILLRDYPVARTCSMKAWLPWVLGMALFTTMFLRLRTKIRSFIKARQNRVKKLNSALEEMKAVVETSENTKLKETFETVTTQLEKLQKFAKRCAGAVEPPAELPTGVAEPREVKSFCDGLRELGEWWTQPFGGETHATPLPSADEEKALLAAHYADEEAEPENVKVAELAV